MSGVQPTRVVNQVSHRRDLANRQNAKIAAYALGVFTVILGIAAFGSFGSHHYIQALDLGVTAFALGVLGMGAYCYSERSTT